MITLQDMPDDVLEMIYSNLTIYEVSNTNKAIHKRITKSNITDIYRI